MRNAKILALGIIALCGFALTGALVLEHLEGLAPCPMCLMQRLWVIAVGLAALIGLAHNARWGIYPMLTAVAAIIGGSFSIRQLYLQSLPPEEVPACGPPLEWLLDGPVSDLLSAMTQGTGDCAEVMWTFLGLSIPAWALVGFIAALALALLQLRATLR